jgi:hypothetical protein
MVVTSVTRCDGRAFHHHHGATESIAKDERLWEQEAVRALSWNDQCFSRMTTALTDTAVAIGNTSRAKIDKFEYFGLRAVPESC